MSYLSEIVELERDYRYSSLIAEETVTEDEFLNSDRSIWTLGTKATVTFKKDVKPCCFSDSRKTKCSIDLKKAINKILKLNSSTATEVRAWEQYDISIFCKGNILDPDNVIGGAVITRPVTIKQTTGSIARLIVPGTTETILNIRVNNTIYGTILFPAGSSSGVITITSTIEMNDGDILNIVSTNTFDIDAQDYLITLSGIAQNIEVWDTRT